MRPRVTHVVVIIMAMLGGCAGSTGTGKSPVGVDLAQLTQWDIVVAEDATTSESYAATEFQHWFEQASGLRLPLVQTISRADHHVFVGPSKALRNSDLGFATDDYGEEDLRIVVRDGNIAIAGGRPRGTLYGVYTFLEDYLGIRFLTIDHTHVPRLGDTLTVGPLDRFYHPQLLYRHVYDGELELRKGRQVEAFCARLRMNARLAGLRPEYGGRTPYRLINHSFFYQLPTHTYGAEHPEYYALHEGERHSGVADDNRKTQPCLTNPDVLRIIVDAVNHRIAAEPASKNISVSQNDNTRYCECKACAAIDELQGSHMGALLSFVNAVADSVAQTQPDVLVGTLAYQYSSQPPATIRPRDNVMIQLCNLHCSILQPIDDPACQINREFCQKMAGWGKICDQIFIWTYNTNFWNYQIPCPNLHVIQPNIQYFASNGAKGVFMQGAYTTLASDMCDLRNYVTGRLLWDHNQNMQLLIDEFLDLHYGPAAPPVRRFVQAVYDAARSSGLERGCFAWAEHYGIDDDQLAQTGLAAFAEAMALAEDTAVRHRVEKASIGAYRLALEPIWRLEETEQLDTATKQRMLPIVTRFLTLCDQFEVGQFREHHARDAQTAKLRALVGLQ